MKRQGRKGQRAAAGLAALLLSVCMLAAAGGEAPDVLWMLPLDDLTVGSGMESDSPAADPAVTGEETEPGVLRMLPLEDAAGAGTEENDSGTAAAETESGDRIEAPEILNMLPLEDAPSSGEKLAERLESTPDSNGLWIYGPEKMKVNAKKYFKAMFSEAHPKRLKITWSLDCDSRIAQVYQNGQVWVRRKAQPGTLLTLRCHAEGKDQNGQLWTADATQQIEVK